MPRAPRITGAEAVRALRRLGWREAYQKGSHIVLVHPDRPQKRVVVPLHPGRILKAGTLAAILDRAGLDVEEFRRVL